MNKIKSLLIAGVIALALEVFSACSGSEGGNSSVVSDAVKAAEETVGTEASPVLGQVPCLQAQYKEANKQLKAHFKEAGDKLEANFKNGGSMEDAIRESAKLDDERKAADKELKQLYKEKVMTEVDNIAERALKVTFDESQYSAANAKIVAKPDSSIANPIIIEVELTLSAKPYTRGSFSTTAYCCWEYQDADNNKLHEGAQVIQDSEKLQAGDKFKQRIIPPLSQEEGMKFDHLYFKKAD